MSDASSQSAAASAAGASSDASANKASAASAADAMAKKPPPAQNPALKMMGLPRFRLPSRNWMIFLSITGSFAGAVVYDKWQTKRMREKWCNAVSHLAEEPLPTTTLPRKLTVYLSAPPGDGLRMAREHFHLYVKPVLVAAAMDWDVVEGRKEGDVRHKTAERIRKRRKRNGEGSPLTTEEEEEYVVQDTREKHGHIEFPGIAGDIVIGRNTWKEYIRGIHEGYLGPADSPKDVEDEVLPDTIAPTESSGHSSLGDAAIEAAANVATPLVDGLTPDSDETSAEPSAVDDQATEDTEKQDENKKAEEKPKRRFPASTILPADYQSAVPSPSMPEVIGPSAEIRFPHLLGIRNTPIRTYRFLTRRRLADDIGRQVASAVLASYRPYGMAAATDEDSAAGATVDVPEQRQILASEERDWYKKVHQPREQHEESIWIEPVALDERIASRMRSFQLTSEDEDRAKRLQAGLEKPITHGEDDQ